MTTMKVKNEKGCYCGKSSFQRIVGGKETVEGEYPWQAAIK